MRTNKLLAFAAVALLIINGVLVYFLWNERKKPVEKNKGNGPRGNWFAEQLKLDSNQKNEHKKLRDAHFESMKPLFDSTTALKTKLFNLMKEAAGNDSTADIFTQHIADLEKQITLKNFSHFKQVRALLNTEQQAKYDEMMLRMINRKGPPGRLGADKKKEESK